MPASIADRAAEKIEKKLLKTSGKAATDRERGEVASKVSASAELKRVRDARKVLLRESGAAATDAERREIARRLGDSAYATVGGPGKYGGK